MLNLKKLYKLKQMLLFTPHEHFRICEKLMQNFLYENKRVTRNLVP